MKKRFLCILAAAAAVFSCVEPKDTGLADGTIVVVPEEGGATKALLNNTTLKTNGNRVHVIDVLTGFTGTASWMSGNQYINEDVVYSGAAVWGYNSGLTYPWTTTGTHRFFAWLSYDASMNLEADSHFNTTLYDNFSFSEQEGGSLSVPAFEMTTETPQLDFLYGNTVNYIMPSGAVSPVPLVMQHLFSAISIQLSNESQDHILVQNVTIDGLKNKRSATVTFVGYPAMTDYTASTGFVNNALFYTLPDATRTLAEGETYDILARVKNTSVGEYRLIWPQGTEDLAPGNVDDLSTYPITVQYKYLDGEDDSNHTAHLRFPEGMALRPGFRYAITLLFTQKHIELNFRVNPWEYNLNEWSFREQSISEVTELDFKGNEGYDKPSKTCRIIGGNPVKGTFRVVNPSGAFWSIEPIGDVEYFTISPNQGMIDSDNPNYEFYVIPNLDPSLDRSVDKKLKFKFHVRFTDGTYHDANSEINRDDWTVILPKN